MRPTIPLLELRPPRAWIPPPGLLWFLAGSICTLAVLVVVGVLP